MNAVVEAALPLWGLQEAEYALVAARENAVFRVTKAGTTYALRLHRKGYRSDAQLWSELQWMAACARGGLSVPHPVASTSGEMMHSVQGTQVDVLGWLQGAPVDDRLRGQTTPQRTAYFHKLGQQMAQLHHVSDAWTPPAGFDRPAWDLDGLLGEAPLWDRFWENPALTDETQRLFSTFRAEAKAALSAQSHPLDYGLIHADLVPANVMTHNGAISLIDFDDGGYGYRLFDVATALFKYARDPDFADLQGATLTGYRSLRPLDTTLLPLFMALRACTYVGWNISRMDEDPTRNSRFIATARHFVRQAFDT